MSTNALASATKPEVAQPTCPSILNIFSILSASINLELNLLSTINTTPFLNLTPTVVVPLFTASLAYSTWNNLPSGENTVIAPLSGIAGSSKTGKNCQIGGSGGLSGHVTIGDNVKVQACSAAWKDAKDNSVLRGAPAFNERDFNRSYVHFKNLDKYVKEIENLKKKNDSSN